MKYLIGGVIGAVCSLVAGYIWFVWYFKDVFK